MSNEKTDMTEKERSLLMMLGGAGALAFFIGLVLLCVNDYFYPGSVGWLWGIGAVCMAVGAGFGLGCAMAVAHK